MDIEYCHGLLCDPREYRDRWITLVNYVVYEVNGQSIYNRIFKTQDGEIVEFDLFSKHATDVTSIISGYVNKQVTDVTSMVSGGGPDFSTSLFWMNGENDGYIMYVVGNYIFSEYFINKSGQCIKNCTKFNLDKLVGNNNINILESFLERCSSLSHFHDIDLMRATYPMHMDVSKFNGKEYALSASIEYYIQKRIVYYSIICESDSIFFSGYPSLIGIELEETVESHYKAISVHIHNICIQNDDNSLICLGLLCHYNNNRVTIIEE